MSLFEYDPVEEQIDTMYQSVTSLAFGRLQWLPIDRTSDAAFYDMVLKPIMDRYSSDEQYKVAHTTQSKSRSGERGAECTRVSFIGENEAESAPAKEAERFDRDAELPYAENELDDEQLGIIVLYELPFVTTAQSQADCVRLGAADSGDAWTALLVKMIAERDRLLRGARNAVATVFDFPTMRRIVNEAYVVAMRRNVRLPSVLERAANAAFLVAVPPSPFWQTAQRTYRVAQMFHNFIDQYILHFYAASLDSELLATSAAFSHAANKHHAAVGVLPPNIVNTQPPPQQHSAVASPIYDPFRELGAPLKRRAISSTANNTDTNSVVSIATTTFSLHSRVQLPGGWHYGYERSPFSSTTEASELSDRLRGELCASPATTDTGFLVRRAPPRRLVWRFTFAMTCAVHLLGEYCASRVDRWRVTDFYYLFQLGMLERDVRCREALETLSAHPPTLAAETRTAIAYTVALDGVLDACDGAGELEHLVYGVVYAGDDIAALVRPLFEKHQLHSVIESYQTRNNIGRRVRRSRATLVTAHLAPLDELQDFVREHALLWYTDRIRALAANDRASFDPVTSMILRFDAEHASPLALLSSMRNHVPSARDGIDFLVVWSPREYPRADTTRPRVYVTMCRWLYRRIALGAVPRACAERRMAGRYERKQPLAAPRIVRALYDADTNVRIDALGAVQALCASLQWASGAQWVPERQSCVLSARAAVDSLQHVARAFRCWGSGVVGAVNRATAIVSAVTDDREGIDSKRRTTPYSNIFSALHVALSHTHNFGFMTLEEAHLFVKRRDDKDPLQRFVTLQLAANRERVRTLSRSDSDAVASEEADKNLQCVCGASPQHCDRMRRMLEVRRARQRKNAWPDRPIECCICSTRHMDRSIEKRAALDGRLSDLVANESAVNIALLLGRRKPKTATSKKRRRRTMKNYTSTDDTAARYTTAIERCCWCFARNVVSSSLPRGIFVELYDPTTATALDKHGGARMTMHEIVASLARTSDYAALSALRISNRAWHVKDTPLPRTYARQYSNGSATKERDASVGSRRAYVLGHVHVTKLTANLVPERLAPAAAAAEVELDDDDARGPLLDMLIELEVLTMRKHKKFGALLKEKKYETLAAELLPFDARTRRALLTASDEVLIGTAMQFPLCESVLVETTPAYGTSRWHADANRRERDLLANTDDVLMHGRTPRPFVGLPPAFAELLMLHYYTASDTQ